jgi:hypothetical protein
MSFPSSLIDHKNNDPLDNRKINLREVTSYQNLLNSKPRGLVPFKGVTLESGRFRAKIIHKGKKISIGNFDTAEEAAKAYDSYAFRLKGEFAYLNFINNT